MKIALAHFRVGETDGVSLEMEKWKLILERMGHEVVFLAGSEGQTKAYVIEELHYKHPLNDKFVYNAYDKLEDYESPEDLKEDILGFAARIEEKLLTFIEEEEINMIVPNNIWSLGWGLPAGIGFTNAAKRSNIQFVCHHHDFHWERDRYSSPTCSFVQEWLEEYFPPNLDNVRHCVINHIAKEELYKRRGITAQVVPNVFDFAGELWKEEDYNKEFRSTIGVGENDIVILQATRIAERKAIELAIDTVAEIQKRRTVLEQKPLYNGRTFTSESRIVYVLAGLPESSPHYIELLKKKGETLGVEMLFINDIVDHSRGMKNGKRVYSLWDAYVIADFVSYPSILEGWGNQLLEAVFAKRPMVVYEYPVFVTDIKERGFTFSTLGNTHTINQDGLVEVDHQLVVTAAEEAVQMLTSGEVYQETTDCNFAIARDYYSMEALQGYLAKIF
ncbi:glycosyl transferase family 1 [Rhodococcus qingshengii]|nr:glycosyl transferase family 1 [Rhodococcus qingshengii]